MLANLKPYPEMKDSGVEWLGEVPRHWTTERLKSSVTNVVEPGTERRGKDLYVALEHVESWTGQINGASPDVGPDSQLKRFAPGDVLFGKLRPYLAKVTRPTTGGLCVGEFLVLRPRDTTFDTGFLERLLRAKPIIDTVDASTFGAKMPRADWTFIGSMKVVQPPLVEQDAIVRFLDHADRRIQRYIRAREKLIALLEEQKQALIHEAVTGRIDVRTGKPYPAYKESGVEWLGDIPEHWHTKKLRQCVKSVGGMTPSMEDPRFWGGDVPWVTPKDMKRDAVDESSVKVSKTALDETSLRLIDPPAVLMVVRGMILARKISIAWIMNSVTINQDMKALIPNPGFEAEFLARALMAAQGALASGIDVAGHGTRRLPTERWRALGIPIAPLMEQQSIMTFVSSAIREIDEAVGNIRSLIDGLGEFRTRLIADVVTGKIDVREAAAALPEEPSPSGNDQTEVEVDAGIRKEALEMTDWDTCPAVERNPRKISGAWAFTGTRVPVYALFENLESGATVKQFLEWFPDVKEWQVAAVLHHEAEHLRTTAQV